jgi:hypothetical protein
VHRSVKVSWSKQIDPPRALGRLIVLMAAFLQSSKYPSAVQIFDILFNVSAMRYLLDEQ